MIIHIQTMSRRLSMASSPHHPISIREAISILNRNETMRKKLHAYVVYAVYVGTGGGLLEGQRRLYKYVLMWIYELNLEWMELNEQKENQR